jgi:NAD(P)-dependent dehydrogenase (short-subunit alcohol dehydrogenase family)
MDDVGQTPIRVPRSACVFGASGGIGRALCEGLAAAGCERVYAGSRSGAGPEGAPFQRFAFNLTDEASIASAAAMMRADPPEWVIVATGVLTLPDGTGPERSYRRLEAGTMAEVFALNTIGPALIAKHCLALMPRGRRARRK